MKSVFISLLLGVASMAAQAQTSLEDFAKKPQFRSMSISPDGKHIAFNFESGNQVKLGVLSRDTGEFVGTFNVGEGREVDTFSWLNNERVLMTTTNITGWLDGKRQEPAIIATNIDGKKRKMLIGDGTRRGFSLLSYLDSNPDRVIVSQRTNGGRGRSLRLYEMHVYTGRTYPIEGLPDNHGGDNSYFGGAILDLNDQLRLATETDYNDFDNPDDDVSYLHFKNLSGDWEILTIPRKGKEPLQVNPYGFNKANSKFYFSSNHEVEDGEVPGLYEFDFKTSTIKFLFRHADVQFAGSVRGANGEFIGVRYDAGYPDYFYVADEDAQAEINLHKSLRAGFQNQLVSIGSHTSDKKTALVSVRSDQNPGEFYLMDTETKKVSALGKAMPQIDTSKMAYVEPFVMEARDGTKMYGQMTIPPGKELKDLPMVIFPHGGPYGPKDTWRWDNRTQLMASRGYLVVQLNFRGSGGYGKNFLEKGYGEWGNKMQDDLTDATLWAVEQGFADRDRICIHGVSYGGYASMQAVVKEPDLYKCSIPDAGIYEMEVQWRKADSFGTNEDARVRYFKQMLGEDYEPELKKRSPAYHVSKMKAALFLVHGTEDVRVPIENAYFLEEELKKAGKTYETMYKEDGHGFQKVEHRIELYDRLLKFLDKHIGH